MEEYTVSLFVMSVGYSFYFLEVAAAFVVNTDGWNTTKIILQQRPAFHNTVSMDTTSV